MTFERANSDLLIFWPSLNLIPSAFVFETPSDPAKSTRLIYDDFIKLLPVCKFFSLISMLILKTVCDLEDFSLSLVSAMILCSSPFYKNDIVSDMDFTSYSESFSM
jgi:hypothetical protein